MLNLKLERGDLTLVMARGVCFQLIQSPPAEVVPSAHLSVMSNTWAEF
jgi:hypothetical protein